MLNSINASKLATLNHSCGIKINSEIINVSIDIDKLNELDITTFSSHIPTSLITPFFRQLNPQHRNFLIEDLSYSLVYGKRFV